MLAYSGHYGLFMEFIKTFSATGFRGMDLSHPLLTELENKMQLKRQFFFIADLIRIEILYTSRLSKEMLGIDPVKMTPYHFFEATHPDDIQRHNLGRLKLFNLAHNLFIEKKGEALLSSNLKLRNPSGQYTCVLVQCYLVYLPEPINTVYEIQIHTDIDWYKKNTTGFHYYTGNDMSFFRYPDEELLNTGLIFSKREFEILRLIEKGLSSDDIGEALFISKHTVNTHRSNMLNKTGNKNIFELIFDLKESGLL